jgi:hypothetical protein
MVQVLRILACVLAGLVLAASFGLVAVEGTWVKPVERSPEENFLYGSMGTELIPLKAFRVLPDLFPDRFQPAGPDAGDWVEQFGFNRGKLDVNAGLPVGFVVSNHRPQSGAPSPVPFVGFGCALCHSAVLRTPGDGPKPLVLGMGNNSLDLFAWIDALQGAILDRERLTLAAIDRANRERFSEPLSAVEWLVVGQWLMTARGQLEVSVTKWDDPQAAANLRDPRFEPNGPGRTQAFRELARLILDRPGANDRAYSKLPAVFRQADREWAQYDGSARNPLTRSVLASLAAGATVETLEQPDTLASVRQNVVFVSEARGPRYRELFPDRPADPAKAERGRGVYLKYCNDCHGHPEGDTWVKGRQQGELMTPAQIGTDPERLEILHYDELTDALYNLIQRDSPLYTKREDLRPGPLGHVRGYINAPLESVFARVPYLHNGSVLTLAELINLKPRRAAFFRGRNDYDPEAVGLASPGAADVRHYYRFDTSRPGNSNRGHDYPWPYKGPGWDADALAHLLEYLKTF